jgi:hypothetical protein
MENFKLKEELLIIVHQWDEVVKEKNKTQAVCNKSIQKL